MKITNRNGRADKHGRHNDRNFDLDKAPHIDKERVSQNKYYTYNGETELTFRELELEYYKTHFEQGLEEKNERYRKNRNASRVRTIAQMYSHKYTMPEDKILQIGDINEHASAEDLWACAMEYKDRFEDIYGDHCKILDMALHMDEATPHVHIRRVWFVEDEKGNEIVSQSKALDALGILPPRPDQPIGRYNNPKMTQTQTDWELFKSICSARGLDIEMDGPTENRERLSTKEYKAQEHEKEYQEIDKSVQALANFIRSNPYIINMYEEELEEAEQQSLAKRNAVLVKIMTDTYEKLHGQIDIADKYDRLLQFVEEKGLMQDYDEWRDERYPEQKEEKTKESKPKEGKQKDRIREEDRNLF